MKPIRLVLAWAIAVVVAAALGSLVQTQINLAALAELGADIGAGERWAASIHDLIHFTPLYGALVAVAFLIAFPVAGGLSRWQPAMRSLWYNLAGFFSIWTMLVVMNQALPITGIAAARSLTGVLALSLAGAIAGWIHARLTRPG